MFSNRNRKSICIVSCCSVSHTNVGLTLLANKLITVCDLCPLPLLTPPPAGAAAASRQARNRWDVWGRVSLYTGMLSLKFYSLRLYFHLRHFT